MSFTGKQPYDAAVTVRLSTEDVGELAHLATQGDRTVSSEVRRAIRRHLAVERRGQVPDDERPPD